VIDRYQFKDDESGYLGARRKHLYLLRPVARTRRAAHARRARRAAPGLVAGREADRVRDQARRRPDRNLNFDIYLIEPKRRREGAPAHHVPGLRPRPVLGIAPELEPGFEAHRVPAGRRGRDIYYAPWQLAVIDVASGKATLPAPIDRCFYKPRWRADGKSIVALIERNLVTNAARIELASGKITTLDPGPRFDYDLDVSKQGASSCSAAPTRARTRSRRSSRRRCGSSPTTTRSSRRRRSRPPRRSGSRATTARRSRRCW
jgi:hypothetical protein